MTISSETRRRAIANAKALSVFGVRSLNGAGDVLKEIRSGHSGCVFTIGYERRSGEELFAALRDAGVDYLADIRDKPVSRKPDFRASALQAACEVARIEYGSWPDLGSTEAQRDRLHETGDIEHFHRVFRAYAKRSLTEPIEKLSKIVKKRSVALLCYERAHEECHRSVVADLIADQIDARVVAIS